MVWGSWSFLPRHAYVQCCFQDCADIKLTNCILQAVLLCQKARYAAAAEPFVRGAFLSHRKQRWLPSIGLLYVVHFQRRCDAYHVMCCSQANWIHIYNPLTMSAGMPILMPMAFLFMMWLFWSEKILLLRLYKKPPAITSELLRPIVSFIPFACLAHSLFAVWCYSAKTSENVPLLPLPSLGPAVDVYIQAFNNITLTNPDAAGVLVRYNVVERILNWVTFPSFIFSFLLFLRIFILPWLWNLLRFNPAFMIAYGIVKGVLYSIFTILKTLLCCCCSKKNQVAPHDPNAATKDEDTYDMALKTGQLRGVKDYELSSNPLYSSVG